MQHSHQRSDLSASSFARTMSRGNNISSNQKPEARMGSTFKYEKQSASILSPSISSVLVSSSNTSSLFSSKFQQSQRSYDVVMTKPTRSPTKRMTPSSKMASDHGMNIGTPSATPTHCNKSMGGKSAQKSPRTEYMTLPSMANICFHTPKRKISASPSISSGDRFIPNRSQMRLDLCRASIFSAEKKRLEFVEKKVKEYESSINSDTINVSSHSNNDSTNGTETTPIANVSSEILTPIQSEFRARMRGALLSLPLDSRNSVDNMFNSSINGRGGSRGTTATVSSTSITDAVSSGLPSRNVRSDLAYTQVPDMESENIVPNKLLSFSGNLTDGMFSTLSTNHSNPSNKPYYCKRYDSLSGPSVPTPDPYCHDHLRVLDRSNGGTSSSARHSFENDGMSVCNKVTRRINTAPTRILDAPELVDDYYLNLISWGAENTLAVALGQCVYLWNSASGDINHLLTLPGAEDFVTSVKWDKVTGNTKYLAVGTNDGPVQLWDTEAMRKVRSLGGHAARVGSLDFNQHWLSSGGRDSVIIQHDIRSAQHITSTYAGHTQEVCGLAWSEDGTTLASGGNENYLCIWDAAMSARRNNPRRNDNRHPPRLTLTQHLAAVKALAWCPFHRGLLASGGGTADRTIKFWNSNSGAVLNSVDTGSQVCSLLWSKHQREICSSHGFSENQLILWRYPNMTKIQEFKGHTARVSKQIIQTIYLFITE